MKWAESLRRLGVKAVGMRELRYQLQSRLLFKLALYSSNVP